ncbi:hypothetical protein jhhlp_002730 [Lomentospora prolificans]|uniref:Uncharacterized protein n=1 Tax=Lomentospora prolificans TaxID=41688 RepID=A0A2N3NEZ1_9PEZI|nr:hypothetical protein jhhlp_002730 [Lomentospora prolificans]
MTPDDVEAVLQGRDGGVAGHQTPPADEQQRVKFLQDVLADLEKAWGSRDPIIKTYAEKLAVGSRIEQWRLPLGESGILDFFIGVLAEPDTPDDLALQCLRLIGNSCADTGMTEQLSRRNFSLTMSLDENRDRVVKADAIPNIIHFASNTTLRPFSIAVLYNVMVDYDPAQLQASNSKVSSKLIDLFSGPDLEDVQPSIDLICKILNLVATKEYETANADPKTPAVLLSLATNPETEEPEDFLSLVSVAQEYLTHAPLQTAFITAGSIPLFLSVFEAAHSSRFDPETLDDPALSNRVSIVRKVLINALSDITDNPAFAQTHPISSPVFTQLGDWLNTSNPALQSAACLALGNLARDDDSTLSLIATYTIHTALIKILADPSNTNALLIHSALGFLKNLAPPATSSASSSSGVLPVSGP